MSVDNDEPGTLGCFAADAQGRPVMLSAAHVIFPGFARPPGLAAYSPDYSTCCSGGELVGTAVLDGFSGFNAVTVSWKKSDTGETGTAAGSETDCAIAGLAPVVTFQNVFQRDGWPTVTITGAVKPVASPAAGQSKLGVMFGPPLGTMPSDKQLVRILTRRGIVWGTLMTPPATQSATYSTGGPVDSPMFPSAVFDAADGVVGARTNVNQLLILPRPSRSPGETWAQAYARLQRIEIKGGDSGSVVVDWEGKVIGLVCRSFATSKLGVNLTAVEFSKVTSVAVTNPIDKVLSLLGITIPEALDAQQKPIPFGGTVPKPATGSPVQYFMPGSPLDPERGAERHGVDRLRGGLAASRRGRVLMAKVNQHRREVRALFSRVRAIASAWHELAGPAYYHHCVVSVRRPGHQIPTRINGVTRAQLAEGLLPLIELHASPALRRDIARYRDWAAAALLAVASMDEVPAALARRYQAPAPGPT